MGVFYWSLMDAIETLKLFYENAKELQCKTCGVKGPDFKFYKGKNDEHEGECINCAFLDLALSPGGVLPIVVGNK